MKKALFLNTLNRENGKMKDLKRVKWEDKRPNTIEELIEMYRPKQIDEYDEDGKKIRVFEAR